MPKYSVAYFLYNFSEMSEKKKKEKDKTSVESEISRLCDNVDEARPRHEPNIPEPSHGFQNYFTQLMEMQASQHAELMKAVAQKPQPPPPPPPPPPSNPIAPMSAPQRPYLTPRGSAPNPRSNIPQGLFTYEPDEEDLVDSSDEEQADFEGWDVPPSGQITQGDSASAHDSSQATASTHDFHPLMAAESGLFYDYDQMPNWRGAPEIFAYLEEIINKEVPAAASKDINDNFTPEIKYQHLFAAPVLPQAITDRLTNTPKGLAKVPKVVNDTLIRAVCIIFFKSSYLEQKYANFYFLNAYLIHLIFCFFSKKNSLWPINPS